MSWEQDIYKALVAAGLSSVQAAGVMGNIQSESSFDVEANAMDSNGARSYGMIQWNAASYPAASSLVTGNRTSDLQRQVSFLLHNTNNLNRGLAGSTAAQVAGNFAQYVEVCSGCQPGGSSYNQRVSQANQIYNAAATGQWGSGGSGITAQNTGGILAIPGIPNNPGGGSPLDLGNLGSTFGNGIVKGFMKGIEQAFGVNSFKDLAERLGLILLGVALVWVGLQMFSKGGTKVINNLLPVASGGGTVAAGHAAANGAAGKAVAEEAALAAVA